MQIYKIIILSQPCQKIVVGDRFQAIYQFRGSVNAMGLLPFENLPLNKSFRYGPKVASLAQRVLAHIDPEIQVEGAGFDTEVFRGSDYKGNSPFLFVSYSNNSMYDVIRECYLASIPAKIIGEKTDGLILKLESLISFHDNNEPLTNEHKKFKTYTLLSRDIRDSESKRFCTLIDNNPSSARELLDALKWSAEKHESECQVLLSTAHMCKGLEHDTVFLADDFTSIIDAFGSGKAIDEADLYLIYVALTRPKKTLVIADALFDALERNSMFRVIPIETPEYLTDGLILSSKAKSPNETPEPEATKKVPNTEPAHQEASPNLGQQKSNVPVAKPVTESESIKIHIGTCKDSEQELFWTPTDTSRYFNPNFAILGTMGTGKTQLVKSMLYQLRQSAHLNTGGEPFGVLIFDYKNDYTGSDFVNATGATVYQAQNIPINPLAIFTEHNLAPIHTARGLVSTLSKVFRLGPKQELMLKNVIMLAYDMKGIERNRPETFSRPAPTMNDVYNIFVNQEKVPQDSLLSALDNIAEYELFEPNGRKCKNLFETLKDNVIVINLSGADVALQNLIVAVLLDVFYTQMHQSGKPQPQGEHRALSNLVLVDEADNLMSYQFPALKKILKEGREFGVGMLLSTQGIDHFKHEEGNYMDYINGLIAHCLNNPKKADIGSLFGLESKSDISARVSALTRLDKHHALLVDGQKMYFTKNRPLSGNCWPNRDFGNLPDCIR